jgi:hypothetical protein
MNTSIVVVHHFVTLLCHASALFDAAPAYFGALPAMLHLGMFFTLGRTGLTNLGAKGAQLLCVFAAEAHQFGCRAANGGTFQVEADAPG